MLQSGAERCRTVFKVIFVPGDHKGRPYGRPERNCLKRPPCQRGLSPKVTGGFNVACDTPCSNDHKGFSPSVFALRRSHLPRHTRPQAGVHSATGRSPALGAEEREAFTSAFPIGGRFFTSFRMTVTYLICHSERMRGISDLSLCGRVSTPAPTREWVRMLHGFSGLCVKKQSRSVCFGSAVRDLISPLPIYQKVSC